jgi:hypothetical protein
MGMLTGFPSRRSATWIGMAFSSIFTARAAHEGLVDHVRWADRCFATARFRCTGRRYNGARCRAIGMPAIRPAELLPVGGPVTLAFLWCNACVWEIDQAQLDKPPWSGSAQRYRCPGCGDRVEWHIHGPAWRPVPV